MIEAIQQNEVRSLKSLTLSKPFFSFLSLRLRAMIVTHEFFYLMRNAEAKSLTSFMTFLKFTVKGPL